MPKFKTWLAGLSASSLDDTADEIPIRDDSADGMLRLPLSTLDARFVNVTGDTAAIGLSGASSLTVPAAANGDTTTAARTTAHDSTLGESAVNGYDIGDTGWRNIAGDLINGWTTTAFRIKRNGGMVTVQAASLKPDAATNDDFYAVPVGFRPPYSVFGGIMESDSAGAPTGTMVPIMCTATGGMRAAIGGTTDYQVTWSYPTDDAWPASLPGV